jgi:CheY-like chemotaxis protein
MRVLVVDDSAAVRQRLLGWLRESTRIELGEAAHPREVLERLRAAAADLVLLDLHLGSIVCGGVAGADVAVGATGGTASGLELIARIKQALPCTLVVVLSNAASEAHRRECLRRGADYFFDKSLEFERALELIASRAATRA